MAAATATAAAAIGSPFSKCNIKSKPWPSDPMFLRITSTVPMLQVSSSLSHSHVRTEPIPISGKWRVMKISASVAQEEAAVTVAEETPEPTEEVVVKEEEEEVSGDGDRTEANSSVNTKLYFGNLPYLCDSAQLAGIIQDYGSPELVEVLYNRETGKSRGFAFVTMSSIEDCKAVIENLDGREYGGRTLRVNFSDKPKPKEPLYPETEYKLFVGNLSWSVTSESLTEMFNSHGNVVGARVLYDGETGRSRGYGFVSYSTKSEMETALQALDGMELEGRSMRVSLAEGKKQ
ncbi:31 kDa ribonucleoprotein, chloroplastic [Cynara cardunculus var. scolymus]|uniref:31 kDa ribonucleoprotein, chloroplastic n=1 Tax=Cynara cardunculus var. scolymus TaxID=59895 RepID=UPI000D626299|nr:31 kDa ribonucleoprotein, chloroplastic [Cynara cardunculus var. scolymus]